MDTGTHLVYGLGIAGLAHIDPLVSSDPSAAMAVFIGAMVGQQAPDFDQIIRMKGNAAYIRNHRGLSHSIPAVFIWTLSITGILALFFSGLPWLNVAFWVFIAVAVHVISDLFNTYGTQALRPFSKKWISWNIIHIFDPVIFTVHIIGILLWALQAAEPQHIFIVVYSFLLLYYLWRTSVHYKLEQNLHKKDPHYVKGDRYILIPTVYLNHWHVVKQRKTGGYATGELRNGELFWVDKVEEISHPAIEASMRSKDIQSLLSFSPHTGTEIKHHSWGYEVHWFDVRYRHRNKYPFVGVVILDKDLRIKSSYVGWKNQEKLGEKLSPDMQS